MAAGQTHHHEGHDFGHSHGHSHGIIDPAIASTEHGLWALKWSFLVLLATALLQLVVVVISGSVALLADTIHNFADAGTAIPSGSRSRSPDCDQADAFRMGTGALRTSPGW